MKDLSMMRYGRVDDGSMEFTTNLRSQMSDTL